MRTKLFILFGFLLLVTGMVIRQSVSQGVVVGLCSTLLAVWVVPRLFARSMQGIVEVAQRLARGDLSATPEILSGERLRPLRRALGQVAETLAATMADLRTERDVLGRILDRMEEGVLVLDGDGQILRTNPALRDMLLPRPTLAAHETVPASYSGEVPSLLDVRGKTVLEVFRNAELAALLERTRADARVTGEIEVEGLKPRRLLVRAVRLDRPQRGFLVVFVDVTDVRRLESLRRDFVANVSHELLTPVAAVRAAAETMRSAISRDPGAADTFIDIIERNTERLHALVEELLELSRIESREFRLVFENVDMPRLLDQVMGMFRVRAEARRQTLRTEIAPEVRHAVTDRRALEMILSNLVDNAVKYCPENTEIIVRAQPSAAGMQLEISDTGPGIAAEHLPRLFERFYRIDPGRSRDRGGTGLGLSIVKHLAEAMQGHAAVSSKIGEGTRFTITLPRRPLAVPAPKPPA